MYNLYIYIHPYTLHRREGRTTCRLLVRIYHPTSSGWTSIRNVGLLHRRPNIPWNPRNRAIPQPKGNTIEWLVAIMMSHSSSIHSFFCPVDLLLTLRIAASSPWQTPRYNNTSTTRRSGALNFIGERSAQLWFRILNGMQHDLWWISTGSVHR